VKVTTGSRPVPSLSTPSGCFRRNGFYSALNGTRPTPAGRGAAAAILSGAGVSSQESGGR